MTSVLIKGEKQVRKQNNNNKKQNNIQLSQSPKHLSDLENTDDERLKALLFIAITSQLFNYLRFISQYGNGNIFLSPYSLI